MIILRFTFLFLILHTTSFASNNYIGIENYSPFIDQVQVNESGDLNSFQTKLGLYFGHKRIIFSSMVLELNGIVYLPEGDADDVLTKIGTRWSAMLHITQWWLFRPLVGSTLHADIYSGKGGVSTQNNGNATSTFFAPNESVVNLYATPVVGIEAKISDSIKAQFLLEVTHATDEEKRFISNFINVQWRL